MADREGRLVHPTVERLAAYGWRLLVLAAALIGLLWLITQLWVALLAIVITVYVVRILDAPVSWLRARRVPDAVAALGGMLLLLGGLALLGWLLVPRIADEFESLGPTLSDAVDDLERWLVEDSPFDVDQRDIDEFRDELSTSIRDRLETSSGTIVSGAIVAVEIVTGVILALITSFFIMKDGPMLQRWALGKVPEPRRELASRLGARAWRTLGAYLRGVVVLGTVEGIIIGVTIAVVGGDLAWPVGVLTFIAAFVPILGAIVAGVVAVLVTLATAGFAEAIIVAVVALIVQQLDNDVLAPVVYGRSLELHPLVVLFAIVTGGALFGFGGTVLAVPVTALIVNLTAEAQQQPSE